MSFRRFKNLLIVCIKLWAQMDLPGKRDWVSPRGVRGPEKTKTHSTVLHGI